MSVFVDSNIIIYAFDIQAGVKHDIAKDTIESLWKNDDVPTVSIQVLQECFSNFIKKEISSQKARIIVSQYFKWHVVNNDKDILDGGMILQERYKISFWDALIISAAGRAKCRYVLSEDFNPGQKYGEVQVVNPFE